MGEAEGVLSMTEKASTYENVTRQFNKAAALMGLDPEIRKILGKTTNEITVNFPVKMDDGRIEVFTGYRVQHNNALGPYKGGLRFHPAVDIDKVRALATWMTWKSAIVNIPIGARRPTPSPCPAWQRCTRNAVSFRKHPWPLALEGNSSREDSNVIDFEPRELAETIEQKGADVSLISILDVIQGRYRYLPQEAMILVSERLGVPLSQVYSVATFYHAFSLVPRGKHTVSVCTGTACHVRGAVQVLDRLETKLGVGPGGTTRDRQFTLETVNCLGCCALGPVVVLDGDYEGQMTTKKVDKLMKRAMHQAAGEGDD